MQPSKAIDVMNLYVITKLLDKRTEVYPNKIQTQLPANHISKGLSGLPTNPSECGLLEVEPVDVEV